MRFFSLVIMSALLLAGCAAIQGTGGRLVDTQASLVAHCESLGLVAETADAGHVSAIWARRTMLRAVRARAEQLGATHLVWRHKTDSSAAAQAYRCPH
ncbi:MAG: hypothetical protein KFF50_02120 [Desulfatitalea sp.]|nr:hypothetical protein [Desulfatitalea sp.]